LDDKDDKERKKKSDKKEEMESSRIRIAQNRTVRDRIDEESF
jgi:hypothetical protein